MTATIVSASVSPVTCAGTPYEMGRTQGEAMADLIAGCCGALERLEPFRMQQPAWLPYPLFRRLAGRRGRRMLAPAVQSASPASFERLRGIAVGSRAASDDLWLLHAMEVLLGSVQEVTEAPPLSGCSTAWIPERSSSVGEPLVAHNFDYVGVVQPYLTMRESRPNGGYRSIEFTAAPLAGTIDGVNEKGLAITYNYGFSVEEAEVRPTITMRISEVLASAATVEEALTRLRSASRWGGGLLMVADASGEAAALELSSSTSGVRRPSGDGMLLHTNKYHCPETLAVEVASDALMNDRAPAALRGERVLHSPETREARLSSLLSPAVPVDLEALQRIMADHGERGQGDLNTICMHSDYISTSACVQAFPRSRSMRVSFGRACQASFTDFAL